MLAQTSITLLPADLIVGLQRANILPDGHCLLTGVSFHPGIQHLELTFTHDSDRMQVDDRLPLQRHRMTLAVMLDVGNDPDRDLNSNDGGSATNEELSA